MILLLFPNLLKIDKTTPKMCGCILYDQDDARRTVCYEENTHKSWYDTLPNTHNWQEVFADPSSYASTLAEREELGLLPKFTIPGNKWRVFVSVKSDFWDRVRNGHLFFSWSCKDKEIPPSDNSGN